MVKIVMTLTAPGCPVAGEMPGWVENAIGAVEGVSGVEVSMTFDPPWTPERMSEEDQVAVGRSEERRVGKACVSKCRSGWSPYDKKKTNQRNRRQQTSNRETHHRKKT